MKRHTILLPPSLHRLRYSNTSKNKKRDTGTINRNNLEQFLSVTSRGFRNN